MSATNEFHVVYPGGKSVTIHSTEPSAEAFCNSHFGSTWESAKEHGASVVMNPGEPVAVEEHAKPKKAKHK